MKKLHILSISFFSFFLVAQPWDSAVAAQKVHKQQNENTVGKTLVQKLCIYCHSEAAVSRGTVKPWDQIISQLSQQDFHVRVTDGIPPYMPGFSELTEDQTAHMYDYLQKDKKSVGIESGASQKGKNRNLPKNEKFVSQSETEEKLTAELRCTCCGKAVKDCSCGMVPKIRKDIRQMEDKDFNEEQIKEALAKKYGQKILPISDITETMSPESFYEVARAYAIAKEIPETLEKIGCFCPCYRSGHANLLDCYKDEHASRCRICLEEALAAGDLSAQGVAEDEICETVNERFRPKAGPTVQK